MMNGITKCVSRSSQKTRLISLIIGVTTKVGVTKEEKTKEVVDSKITREVVSTEDRISHGKWKPLEEVMLLLKEHLMPQEGGTMLPEGITTPKEVVMPLEEEVGDKAMASTNLPK